MTDPLTDNQLAEIRKLLDEVERLRVGQVDDDKAYHQLASRNKELEDLFHLQQSRMGEAVEFWRKETGRKDDTPSLGDLLEFLLACHPHHHIEYFE